MNGGETPLQARLAREIAAAGPISLAHYMHLCLADPIHGYYANRRIFGRSGDFITAPEISQLFGELIGIWCVLVWRAMGEPSRFRLAEAGPGRGVLMADLLRAAARITGFAQACQVTLIETSSQLRAEQARRLSDAPCAITFAASVTEARDEPLILIANEFLDALPIRQFVKTASGWRERCVTMNENGGLAFCLGSSLLDSQMLPPGHEREPEGAVFEYSPAREAWTQELGEQLVRRGGGALLIDYGHAQSGFGDTFQAVRAHAYADPLQRPGETDLTAHVDFAAIAEAARSAGAVVSSVMGQGEFLTRMGIGARVDRLAQGRAAQVQEDLRRAAERLTAADRMGEIYKVIALADPHLALQLGDVPPFGSD